MKGFNKENVLRFLSQFEEAEVDIDYIANDDEWWASCSGFTYKLDGNRYVYRHKANQTPQQFKESDFIFEDSIESQVRDVVADTIDWVIQNSPAEVIGYGKVEKGEDKTMIDLSKNQTFDEPVECWVRDSDDSEWVRAELLSTERRCGDGSYPFKTKLGVFRQCTLTDPNKPQLMTRDEILAWACSAEALGWVARIAGSVPNAPQYYSYHTDVEEFERSPASPTGDYKWEKFYK